MPAFPQRLRSFLSAFPSIMTPLRWISIALLAGGSLFLVWGVAIEPRFVLDVHRYESEVPNLPKEWDGEVIALFSDLQVGMWLGNTRMVEMTIQRVIDESPALVLIAGDFVYHPDSTHVDEAVSLVRPLTEADIPVVAVLGNHDYSMGADTDEVKEEIAYYLQDELRAIGVEVLINESVAVDAPSRDSSVHVVGLGSAWAQKSSPSAAFAGVSRDAARLTLMHNPVSYRDLLPHTSPLTLGAHTHGGQIRVPFTPSESWLKIARPREVVADGWAADSIGAVGNRLYVNRGIGLSVLPIRFLCPPELTLFTLRASRGTLPDRRPGSPSN